MNYIRNDKGDMVAASGAPGSEARVKVEFPALIARINAIFFESAFDYGQGVDRAIDEIRNSGIESALETDSLLRASGYANAPSDSVAGLVFRVME